MSLGHGSTPVYEGAIKPAVERFGIQCKRVDEAQFTGSITDETVRLLRNAYLIIAELSEERPNCYYELGFAHALSKPVLMAIDDSGKIHFNVKDYSFITYKDPDELREKLEAQITGAVLSHEGVTTDKDPRRGQFGRCAYRNNRLLTARINPRNSKVCDVSLRVIPVPRARPITGWVTFYLHSSFKPAHSRVKARDGEAQLKIESERAFTVGAKADKGATILELDLATIPGGRPNFYKR